MKRILTAVTALTFIMAAVVVYAQAQQAPAAKPAETKTTPVKIVPPPVQPIKIEAKAQAPAPMATDTAKKDTKLEVTSICKNKGLAGEALDVCVKDELAKLEKAPAPAAEKAAPAAKPEAKKSN